VLVIVMLGLVQQSLDSRLSEDPCTGIGRLLLAPDDGLGVGVRIQVLFELLPREGEQLLDTGYGDIFEALIGAVLDECGVDLT
jgi:hypothetical protein